MNNSFLSCILLVLIMLASCKEKVEKRSSNPDQEEPGEMLCFENILQLSDSKVKAKEELRIRILDGKAKGIYNWTAEGQDSREGKFSGTIENNIVTATYSSIQNGLESSADITIALSDEMAVVLTSHNGERLENTVKKIECEF